MVFLKSNLLSSRQLNPLWRSLLNGTPLLVQKFFNFKKIYSKTSFEKRFFLYWPTFSNDNFSFEIIVVYYSNLLVKFYTKFLNVLDCFDWNWFLTYFSFRIQKQPNPTNASSTVYERFARSKLIERVWQASASLEVQNETELGWRLNQAASLDHGTAVVVWSTVRLWENVQNQLSINVPSSSSSMFPFPLNHSNSDCLCRSVANHAVFSFFRERC